MSLGESVYLGSGEARKTQQVVLSGTVPAGGATVRWAIRREPKRAVVEEALEVSYGGDKRTKDPPAAESPAGNG